MGIRAQKRKDKLPRKGLLFLMVHIGKAIKAELERQERSVTWFAKKLYCERTNVYSIFKRESIDTELLLRISIVLHRNFFMDYIEELSKSDFSSTKQLFLLTSWTISGCLNDANFAAVNYPEYV